MRPMLVLLLGLLTTALAAPALAGTTARVAFGSDGTMSGPSGWTCEENDSTGWVPAGYTYNGMDCHGPTSITTCADPVVNGFLQGANGVLQAEAHCTGAAPIAAICTASVLHFTLSPPTISPADSCSASASGSVPMALVKCVSMTGAATRPPLIVSWKVECVVTV